MKALELQQLRLIHKYKRWQQQKTIPIVKVKTKRPIPTSGHRRKQDQNKTIDAVLFVLFILSLSLVVWGIDIYRKTIIEPKYLFAVASIGTIIARVILLFVTRDFLNAFWTFVTAAAIGGGIAYFLTLYLNRELAEKELTSETFDILRTAIWQKVKEVLVAALMQ